MSKAFDMQRREEKTVWFNSFVMDSLAGCMSDTASGSVEKNSFISFQF